MKDDRAWHAVAAKISWRSTGPAWYNFVSTQRFDFLVRTREVSAQEAAEYEKCGEAKEPGRLSPYHRAALFALRELTGRDTEPTAAAWRKLLNLPAKQ